MNFIEIVQIYYGPRKFKYMRKNTGIIWTLLDDNSFAELVSKSFSVRDILRYLNLCLTGGNHDACKKRINKLNINTDHFLSGPFISGKKKNSN